MGLQSFGMAIVLAVMAFGLPGYADQSALAERMLKKDYRGILTGLKDLQKRGALDLQGLVKLSEMLLHYEGRTAAKKVLKGYYDNHIEKLSPEDRKRLEDKIREVLNQFLTDEGQSLYFRALGSIQRGDCETALDLLQRAESVERGNLRIRIEQARCEQSKGQLSEYYATLQGTFSEIPFDIEIARELGRAHLYFGKYREAINIFSNVAHKNTDDTVGLAWAMVEQDRWEKAQEQLSKISKIDLQSGKYPILLFALGRNLAANSKSKTVAKSYLVKFIKLTESESSKDKLDPFRVHEHRKEAQAILDSMI